MSGMPAISVVVCAYALARWHDLGAALDSVRGQTRPPLETIVVVDANPELLERLGAARPDVVVAANAGQRGLSSARNTGVALARGDVVAFLDDDAAAAPDWLERLASRYADPAVLAVGGAVAPAWDEGRPAWFPEEFDWVVGCTWRGLPTAAAPVRNLVGANMSVRRDVLVAAGGFPTGLGRVGTVPLGCEETALCIAARQRFPDGVVLYDPALQVRHRVPAERGTWSYFRRRCFAEGLSKAAVGALAGTRDGLSSERAYVAQTLPAAVARALGAAARRRDPAGLQRAGAVVAGLALTTAGYVAGRARGVQPARPAEPVPGEAAS